MTHCSSTENGAVAETVLRLLVISEALDREAQGVESLALAIKPCSRKAGHCCKPSLNGDGGHPPRNIFHVRERERREKERE